MESAASIVDLNRVDATRDEEIQDQIDQDDQEAMADMGEYIRSVRARVGMTQREFANRIGISVDTLRNWEQGRRYPTGTARALLRIIDKAPEAAGQPTGGLCWCHGPNSAAGTTAMPSLRRYASGPVWMTRQSTISGPR